MAEKIQRGEILVGRPIAEREIVCKVLGPDGRLKDAAVTTSGRIIPLHTIRKRKLEEFEKFGICRPKADADYDALTDIEVSERLRKIDPNFVGDHAAQLTQLKEKERMRYM
jgi:hypothetical protein